MGFRSDLNARKGAEFREPDMKNTKEKDTALGNPGKDESLRDQYANCKKVYALWKAHEQHYKGVAREFLKQEFGMYMVAGKY